VTTTTEAPGPETAPTTAEVRAWAERRHLLEQTAAAAAAAAGAADPPAAVETHAVGVKELPGGGSRAPDDSKGESPAGRAEERPEPRRKTVRERLRIVQPGQPEEPGKPPKPRRHRRISLETIGGIAWVGMSRAVAFAGDTYFPVVKMMSFQAPVAGAIFEDVARDTIADRILQPVARMAESGGAVGALIGAPMLTAVICKRPELYPQVRPMLMAAMREWVIVAGPKLREMRRREEKFAEEMSTFTAEFGVTVEELLDEVFASPDASRQAPPPAAAANGQPV
jgi:hypothetical protein